MYTRHPVECVHHWVFEIPNGRVSIGKCKHCGDRTELANSFDIPPPALWKTNFRDVRYG